ncbi:MAG: response regulator [Actinomycetota bacterium]|nr:response regulator [Actinomycetota bacterium]
MALRVVIAEDEAIIRLDLKEILEEEGYEVVGAASHGEEAIEMVRTLRPDLAILDIKMPGKDGIEVAAELSQENICPVVILTAFSQRSFVEQARDAGVLAYLVKPFQALDLVPAIELARARFEEKVALELEVANLTDKAERATKQLEARKLLDRAKGILMDTYYMSEPDAFGYIQKTAMDSRIAMAEVAQKIISGELSPKK